MSDEQPSRADLERALRFLNNVVTQMRSELLQLGAQVVTLTRTLEERGAVAEAEVLAALPAAVEEVRIADEVTPPLRVELARAGGDKNDVESPPVPCAELMPICHARCCMLAFPLSTQDLEERVVRWDYGRPYWNQRRADGYCVHNQAGSCGVYQHRPATCRSYDCRDDRRIWQDYDKRIPAADSPRAEGLVQLRPPRKRTEVAETAHDRHIANEVEDAALRMDRL